MPSLEYVLRVLIIIALVSWTNRISLLVKRPPSEEANSRELVEVSCRLTEAIEYDTGTRDPAPARAATLARHPVAYLRIPPVAYPQSQRSVTDGIRRMPPLWWKPLIILAF